MLQTFIAAKHADVGCLVCARLWNEQCIVSLVLPC